jgi:hypothetical protein
VQPDYASLVQADGPVGYWRLGDADTGTARDRSGHGLDGTVQGTATVAPGALVGDAEGAMRLDGTGGGVLVHASSLLDTGAAITLEAWIRPASMASARPVMEYVDGRLRDPRLWTHDPGDRMRASFATADGMERALTSDEHTLAAGTWYHVVATCDGSTARLYVDGHEVAHLDGSFPLATASDLLLGGDSVTSQAFAGDLDELAVYPRALSAGRVNAHSLAGHHGPSMQPWLLFRSLQ